MVDRGDCDRQVEEYPGKGHEKKWKVISEQ
jgi:hypothetical protein